MEAKWILSDDTRGFEKFVAIVLITVFDADVFDVDDAESSGIQGILNITDCKLKFTL